MNKLYLSALCCGLAGLLAVGCESSKGGGNKTDAGPCVGMICLGDGGARDTGVPRDAGVRRDARVSSCIQGQECDPDRGCIGGTANCIAENPGTIFDDPTDPVSGLDGGVDKTFWVGGYCSTVNFIAENAAGACNINDGSGCGDCGKCISLGRQTADGPQILMCANTCTPSQTSNPCRDGYECTLDEHVCQPGCASDAECRVYREDTNGNGEFDEGVDRLVYDSASTATCNRATGRCTHPAGEGSPSAGTTCTRDAQCEADGACITPFAWPGGYCSKFGCDVAGRECAGTGTTCMDLGVNVCLKGCRVGSEPMADRTGAHGHGAGCRDGYTCWWDGRSGDVDNNGGCNPGNYNEVAPTAPTGQLGSACDPNADPITCYSPYGYGRCFDGFTTPARETGFCAIARCDAPGLPADICGSNGQCVTIGTDFSVCLKNCTSAADCAPSYACADADGSAATPNVCLFLCANSSQCGTGYTCRIPTGDMWGTCELSGPRPDAGVTPVDSGVPAVDAGTPAVDAGEPAADAGEPAADAG